MMEQNSSCAEPAAEPTTRDPDRSGMSRREALEKLGQYAGYMPPVILTLLISDKATAASGQPPPPPR